MVETTFDVPGKYLLVDHSLSRLIDNGALSEFVVEGSESPEMFKNVQ